MLRQPNTFDTDIYSQINSNSLSISDEDLARFMEEDFVTLSQRLAMEEEASRTYFDRIATAETEQVLSDEVMAQSLVNEGSESVPEVSQSYLAESFIDEEALALARRQAIEEEATRAFFGVSELHTMEDTVQIAPDLMNRVNFMVMCPQCNMPYEVISINCQIFRHSGNLGPHATKEQCDAERNKNPHLGCCLPFRLRQIAGTERIVGVSCDYI